VREVDVCGVAGACSAAFEALPGPSPGDIGWCHVHIGFGQGYNLKRNGILGYAFTEGAVDKFTVSHLTTLANDAVRICGYVHAPGPTPAFRATMMLWGELE
jgi:hypothetical protein